jgi:hypothetical protein
MPTSRAPGLRPIQHTCAITTACDELEDAPRIAAEETIMAARPTRKFGQKFGRGSQFEPTAHA